MRKRVQVLRDERDALLEKGNQVVPIQAIFRAFMTRKRDKLVRVSLREVPLLLPLLNSKQQPRPSYVVFQMFKKERSPGYCCGGVALSGQTVYDTGGRAAKPLPRLLSLECCQS